MGIMWPCLGLSHFSIPDNDSCCERLFPSCEARLFLNKYYMLCKIDYLLPTIHDDSGLVYYYRGLAFVSLLNLQAIESGNGKLDWTRRFCILVGRYLFLHNPPRRETSRSFCLRLDWEHLSSSCLTIFKFPAPQALTPQGTTI